MEQWVYLLLFLISPNSQLLPLPFAHFLCLYQFHFPELKLFDINMKSVYVGKINGINNVRITFYFFLLLLVLVIL